MGGSLWIRLNPAVCPWCKMRVDTGDDSIKMPHHNVWYHRACLEKKAYVDDAVLIAPDSETGRRAYIYLIDDMPAEPTPDGEGA